jgi:hypothetical protein
MTPSEVALELARILLINEIEYLKYQQQIKEKASSDIRHSNPEPAKKHPAKSRERIS